MLDANTQPTPFHTHKQNEDDEEENNNKPTTHRTLFVCASVLNFKLGPSSKVFLFSKTFRVVYYTLDSCIHTHTCIHLRLGFWWYYDTCQVVTYLLLLLLLLLLM